MPTASRYKRRYRKFPVKKQYQNIQSLYNIKTVIILPLLDKKFLNFAHITGIPTQIGRWL